MLAKLLSILQRENMHIKVL